MLKPKNNIILLYETEKKQKHVRSKYNDKEIIWKDEFFFKNVTLLKWQELQYTKQFLK